MHQTPWQVTSLKSYKPNEVGFFITPFFVAMEKSDDVQKSKQFA